VPKNLLIIGFVWPEPKSSAAGSRMMQLIDLFKSKNYNITFSSTSVKNDRSFDLKEIGIFEKEIELNNKSFDDFIVQLKPDIVMFDRFMVEEQFGWRIAEHCPNTLRILDTEDLHCLRRGRQMALKDGKSFDTGYLFNDTAKREIASIYRCDLSLIISEVEMTILRDQFKVDEQLLFYLPFLLNEISYKDQKELPRFKDRSHFIFVGNFLHDPNFDAVKYLKESIWPLIKQKLPEAELHVYGAYSSQKVDQLHNDKEGFKVKGFVEDINEAMSKARVCLAPLRFGAGLKGKLIDAIANGTPMVSTIIGAEGLFGNLEPNGFIKDEAVQFAKCAVDLYCDQSIWKKYQANGFKILNARFQKSMFQDNFLDSLEELKNNLQNHRQNNFTGNMLMHHTMQTTKYMGKWIEEKNQKKS
jgi:glycosyltransferase involved in cell wall biosynthesis